ncbi:TPA: endonuclease III [Candidatus Micrarchaeota archaeon]|nr:endonuclease III [Candidatus Micrarchaeota archaeon]
MDAKGFIQVIEHLKHASALRQAPVYRIKTARASSPFAILVGTLLSSRTQDTVTAAALNRLLQVAPSPERLAAMDEDTIARHIYPVGFYRAKAHHLRKLATVLVERYGGRIPQTREELMRLPGVGRKTANLVLGEAFGMPAVCVDTHVHRIANRLGIVRTRTPEETERALMEKLPTSVWRDINPVLVALGQTICLPRRPRCEVCPVASWCERVGVPSASRSRK